MYTEVSQAPHTEGCSSPFSHSHMQGVEGTTSTSHPGGTSVMVKKDAVSITAMPFYYGWILTVRRGFGSFPMVCPLPRLSSAPFWPELRGTGWGGAGVHGEARGRG